MVAGGATASVLVSTSLGDAITDKNQVLADSIAHEVDALIRAYESLLMLFEDTAVRTAAFSNRALSGYALLEEIEVIDDSGRVSFSSTDSATLGFDRSRRDFFALPKASGELYVSSMFATQFSYEPAVTISVPIADGVAMGVLNLETLSSYLRGLSNDPEDLIAVIDAKGYYIAHADLAAVKRCEQAPREVALAPRGQSVLVESGFGSGSVLLSSSRMELCDWTILVAQSTDSLYGPVSYVVITLVFSLVFAAASAYALLSVALRGLRLDVGGLVDYADAVASGDYSATYRESGYREFAGLAGNFRRMVGAVEERETSLRASVEEKEVLLKEVHHRVKNNLQLVESMLSLQSHRVSDGRVADALGESRARIDVLARVHEMLYQSANLAHIDAGEYIRSLAESLVNGFSLKPPYPTLDTDTESISLDVDLAIPCGLIVNELVTNALKYGYDPARGGRELFVGLRRASGRCRVTVADKGPGFPGGFDVGTSATLGLKLVTSLVEQLGGQWTLDSADGARWTVEFPLSEDNPSRGERSVNQANPGL
jgi:two-component sensor histidine kinase